MPYNLTDRLKNAWNAFTSRDPTTRYPGEFYGSAYRPDRKRSFVTNDGNKYAKSLGFRFVTVPIAMKYWMPVYQLNEMF